MIGFHRNLPMLCGGVYVIRYIQYFIFILYTIFYSIWYIVNWNAPKRMTSILQMNILWWLAVVLLYGSAATHAKEAFPTRTIQLNQNVLITTIWFILYDPEDFRCGKLYYCHSYLATL